MRSIPTNFKKIASTENTQLLEEVSPKQTGHLAASFQPVLGNEAVHETRTASEAEALQRQNLARIQRDNNITQDLHIVSSAPYAEEVNERGSDVSGGDFGTGASPGFIEGTQEPALNRIDNKLAPFIENPTITNPQTI